LLISSYSTYLNIIVKSDSYSDSYAYIREMDYTTTDICKHVYDHVLKNYEGDKLSFIFDDLLKDKKIPEEFWEFLGKKGIKNNIKKYIPSDMYKKYFV